MPGLAPSVRRMGDKSSIERTEAHMEPDDRLRPNLPWLRPLLRELDCVHEVPELGAWLKVPLPTSVATDVR